MSLPDVVTREEWLASRKSLLAKEKELRRAQDALNTERRSLPMVRVDKKYTFIGPDGEVGLLDLFSQRHQLIVQHVMFDPEWDAACPNCTAGIDEMSGGLFRHLEERETRYVFVARAPYEKLAAYSATRGWDLPFYSAQHSDFNYDFNVSFRPGEPVTWNYRDEAELRAAGLGGYADDPGEQPGMSCFLRVGEDVFHTYSTYARGVDFAGSYSILDITALGRQEEWEEPKGRATALKNIFPMFES
ncbi:DUF899 domain-containing protein [Catenulispora pinisilvae]|uniref:DUF899 domain-containing protein n=1 Tax=Catenulispora pinisilvae TaxID=2705253 RepID=UPI0018912732|nr:DUF899 domain-containing protein [Catenulispora pinisilvae]